jgi:hypothetical protein
MVFICRAPTISRPATVSSDWATTGSVILSQLGYLPWDCLKKCITHLPIVMILSPSSCMAQTGTLAKPPARVSCILHVSSMSSTQSPGCQRTEYQLYFLFMRRKATIITR